MTIARRTLLLILLFGAAVAPWAARAELQTFEKSRLSIDTAGGVQRFAIELAISPQQQAQGLMFRRQLAPDSGMLFMLGEIEQASFWMKNTLIPLDMLFISADGHVADFHERAVPLSEEPILSKVPVRAVLELNGGTVARLGIKVGDLVHYRAFGTGGAD